MSNGWNSLVSHRGLGLGACLAATIAVAQPARAQFASAIDLSSRSARPTVDSWQSQLAVSPFLRFDNARLALDGRWTATGGDGQRLNGFGNLGATYFSPTRAGLQLSVAGFADRTLLSDTFAVARMGSDARLSYRAGKSGAWLGKEFSRDNRATAVSPDPHYSAGAWRQIGTAILTMSVSSFGSVEGARAPSTRTETIPTRFGPLAPPDSVQRTTRLVVDSGSAGRRHDWRDAELGLHWGIGRLAFQGIVGTRFSATNQPNELWGQAHASLLLASDLALIASSGIRPSSAAYGIARSRFVELGFRVSPSALRHARLPSSVRPTAAAFQVGDAPNGKRTVRIRVPDARSVELSADFTGWKPIALERNDADEWEATLPIAPGMHRIAIRVNGDTWTPPPGIAAVPDEFQGTVGVIVVK